MIVTEGRVVIDASPAAAWILLSDYANDPSWRRGVSRMEQTPPGPVREGARAIEELTVLGRVTRTLVEISEVVPGRSFAWRAIDGTEAHGTRSIEPLPDGRCELRTWRAIRLVGADRWLEPVVAVVMARTERGDVRRAATFVTGSATP